MSHARDRHGGTASATARPLPLMPGFHARLAGEADGPALAALERETPIVLADHSLRIDRGRDYFAAARLMESPVVALGEVNGRAVCIFAGAVQPVRVEGRTHRLMIAHHARVLPEFQGRGLWRAPSRLVFDELGRGVNGIISYVATTNRAGQQLVAQRRKWSVPVLRALLDTRRLGAAAPAEGARSAGHRELTKAAAILNGFHASEEGYVPYTPASLRARLARAPAQYGPAHLWRYGRAVLGVWPAGNRIAEIHEHDGERRVHRQGRVLDYGCLPGGEAELVVLLQSWCRRLEEMGQDQLAVFTSPGSPACQTLLALAADVEHFDLYLALPEPRDAAARGWYVDAAGF